MLSITKEFSFSASHILNNLPDGHQCARQHGHNYLVVVELSADDDGLDDAGFVRDFGELAVIKSWIDDKLDHRHLNDVMDEINPTAENISQWIFDTWCVYFPELTAVRVSETPKTWAEYRPTAFVRG